VVGLKNFRLVKLVKPKTKEAVQKRLLYREQSRWPLKWRLFVHFCLVN